MKRSLAVVLAGLGSLVAWGGGMPSNKPNYPPSPSRPVVEELHGERIEDPYRWLEDGESEEVKEWTARQNAFTEAFLSKLPGREKIRERLDQLLRIGRISVAVPAGGRYFYTKRTGTQNQPILYVREGLDGPDRILLDPNQLSEDGTIALDWWYVSDDGKKLAYGLSQSGSEESVLHVRDVDTGRDLPDRIEGTRACSVAWTPDATGFYYTRYPRLNEPIREKGQTRPASKEDTHYYRHVFFHKLGTDPTADPKVFGEGRDKEDWPNVDLSPDGKWLVVTVEQGWSKSEVYLRPTEPADAAFVPVVEGVEALFSPLIRNNVLFIRTNHEAPRYRLFRVDPRRPGRENWVEIIPQGPDVLDGVAVVRDRLVGLYMVNASSRLRLFDLQGKMLQEIPLPTLGTVSGLGAQWNGNEFFYDFNSFTVPPSVYRYDLDTNSAKLWQQVQSDIDTSLYEVKQVRYRSKDGTPITMFLAHKKGLRLSGNNPTLLTGYGGFNISETPFFGASLFLFLERGGVLALPNLRGGGEYGEEWHQAGMLDRKQNVFDDFQAAARWLIAEKYTRPERLAIMGGSNGGLLMGAMLTQCPELFRAVVCQVPLLDMLRYHRFRIARLWIPEYGDPDDPKAFRWLRAYSPYHNVKPGVPYPATLFTAAESDTRVDPLHARKMTALLQAATSSDQPILLRLETKAGHGAGKPRSKVLDELTDTWTFLFWALQVPAD
ncbi:MAG: prolyl oligopeptidase family serine peptidase [Gemmatales bacterium]|nr:prolyl oligopeptidase family serine peptidase [Gemmatales bacterium]MDW8385940.1 prolyl oligopeptidase family serine peptidase [Gemmatales bacterium]